MVRWVYQQLWESGPCQRELDRSRLKAFQMLLLQVCCCVVFQTQPPVATRENTYSSCENNTRERAQTQHWNMAHFTTSDPVLACLWTFCSKLDHTQRKSLLTLSRSQTIPDPDTSPVLYAKTLPVLNVMSMVKPFRHPAETPFTEEGHTISTLVTSPLFAGLVISFALGVGLTEEQIEHGRWVSFQKEFLATQTIRGPSTWDWDSIIAGRGGDSVIHPHQPYLSKLQRTFSVGISKLRTRIRHRTLFPHYSRRGTSSETSTLLRVRAADRRRYKVHGNVKTFHRGLSISSVTSLDIVHHYVRTGVWIGGRTEMKQKWYPNGLLPRTYFSWGGSDIAISSYLRDFFNELCDCFGPTDRRNRVQPDWLYDPQADTSSGGFAFYDLTSFTSWFHEQVPFLRALARFFSGTPVFLLSVDLTLQQYDLGSLISDYIASCNNFPEYTISASLLDWDEQARDITHIHQCAGFLGIPGNLATCTLPHGLAMASRFRDEHQIQVPGDDIGFSFRDQGDKTDSMHIASTVGVFQQDKVYSLPEASVYLKRSVLDYGHSIDLSPQLVYPLLPFLIDPDGHSTISPQYTKIDRELLRPRAARVLVSFLRDLWDFRHGNLSDSEHHTILRYLRAVHDLVGLPYGAILQGKLVGDFDEERSYPGVSVKFPIEEDDCLAYDPDRLFASKYVDMFRIRMTSDVPVSEAFLELNEGDVINIPIHKGWKLLEDMGYVEVLGIPGDVITLIGVEAKLAYLSSQRPNLRQVRVTSRVETSQLVAVGILVADVDSGEILPGGREGLRGVRGEDLWRRTDYIDLDMVKDIPFRSVADGLYEESVVEDTPSGAYVDLDNLDY